MDFHQIWNEVDCGGEKSLLYLEVKSEVGKPVTMQGRKIQASVPAYCFYIYLHFYLNGCTICTCLSCPIVTRFCFVL